ncbi:MULTISPECIES: peptidylprolyl isomerase [Pseudomonas]|uniref:Peptidylprolyl isomerase n=1 Tax=Pseudomonas mosselii TaxID=78327 RepID=A0A5R8ZHT7_9PSED|nr:peptidylprolyl isomerase [Pseudomonas mosselii]TLP65339.1 peptidylprolyl isomerase [Pseudomonas mosselii]
MSARRLWVGAGALAGVALVVAIIVRPEAASVPASARTPQAPVDTGPALARLGEQQVGGDELKALFAQLPEDARQQLRADRPALEAWIRARLAEKALFQQAETQGWLLRPDVQARIRALSEQVVLRDYLASVSRVPDDYPSEAEIRQAYEAGKAGLQLPARYRLSQIFLRVDNPAQEASVRQQAVALARQAQGKDADFAALAREHSQDQDSAALGGDTGLQALAQLLPEVREVVPKMKDGGISDPVRSVAGWHVIQLLETQPPRAATLEEVAPRLRELLRAQRQEQLAKAYVEGMFDNATLSIDGAAINQVLEHTGS